MHWQEIQDTLTTLLNSIMPVTNVPPRMDGGPTMSVRWEDIASEYIPDTNVSLRLTNIRKIGRDETRYVMDPEIPQVLRENIYGVRLLTIQVTVQSQDQNLATSAFAVADTLRTRLRRQASLQTLREDAELSLSSLTDVRAVSIKNEKGRLVPFATFDLVLHAAHYDVDTSVGGTGWIETAEINGDVYKVGRGHIHPLAAHGDGPFSLITTQDGYSLVAH